MILNIVFQSGEFYNEPDSWFSLKDFFQFLIGVGGWILAYVIYKGYDVKKKVKLSQLDTVVELTKTIRKTKLSICIVKENSSSIQSFNINELEKYLNESIFRDIIISKNLKVLFEVLYQTEFVSFSSHAFIPKPIALELKKFTEAHYDYTQLLAETNDYVILGIENSKELYSNERQKIYKNRNPVYHSLESYLNQVKKLESEIKKWLLQFKIDDLNI